MKRGEGEKQNEKKMERAQDGGGRGTEGRRTGEWRMTRRKNGAETTGVHECVALSGWAEKYGKAINR